VETVVTRAAMEEVTVPMKEVMILTMFMQAVAELAKSSVLIALIQTTYLGQT
jgi:hypothetical protein